MEFKGFPKIPRLNREVIVTEKIDGTNAQIHIGLRFPLHEAEQAAILDELGPESILVEHSDGFASYITPGSRNRWLHSGADNFGFWQWVSENSKELVKLGPGAHFGEWWGRGIQRGYGLDHKRFSLFNVSRWSPVKLGAFEEAQGDGSHSNLFNTVPGLDVVPELARGKLQDVVDYSIMLLRNHGSHAAPGFKDPEGIVIYHTAGNHSYKVTLEKDDAPKTKINVPGP